MKFTEEKLERAFTEMLGQYPTAERDEVYIEIFEQAENFKKNN